MKSNLNYITNQPKTFTQHKTSKNARIDKTFCQREPNKKALSNDRAS
ncbi:hypothetical protein [Methylotenera sp. L2L1]|nr:hypothetical protein [Methylotenera sp. L2L1]